MIPSIRPYPYPRENTNFGRLNRLVFWRPLHDTSVETLCTKTIAGTVNNQFDYHFASAIPGRASSLSGRTNTFFLCQITGRFSRSLSNPTNKSGTDPETSSRLTHSYVSAQHGKIHLFRSYNTRSHMARTVLRKIVYVFVKSELPDCLSRVKTPDRYSYACFGIFTTDKNEKYRLHRSILCAFFMFVCVF